MIATVLVDTNVFTGRRRKDRVLEGQYAKHTVGWRVAVAPQTVAEARYGALKWSWGQRRLTELSALIEHVRILQVDLQMVEAVADRRNRCRSIGPALHQRAQGADRGLPLPRSTGASRSSPTTPCSSAALASTCGRRSGADAGAQHGLLASQRRSAVERTPPSRLVWRGGGGALVATTGSRPRFQPWSCIREDAVPRCARSVSLCTYPPAERKSGGHFNATIAGAGGLTIGASHHSVAAGRW